MSQLPAVALDQLHMIAREIREVFEERGFAIGEAISMDPSFGRSRRGASALGRELISEALELGAARAGVWCDPGPGGSLEMHIETSGRGAVFRLKSATGSDGKYRIVTNNVSTWGAFDDDTLVFEEPWVFAYTTGESGLEDIFIAHVDGITEGRPGVLILGQAITLGVQTPPTKGFQPVDEDLPGFGQPGERSERNGSSD
jgi:hypothetical protein